ncbi:MULTISPECIES: response regulator transcription factor [unclassified Campylobacter]|uniref:response regulator transcription factor n=1 Tax=unclassified Campylobacter TaxID=2593542 RepID=UPI00147623B7|nr:MULTISPECIES: response regulator transcription factor [unclassified Campylobacter]
MGLEILKSKSVLYAEDEPSVANEVIALLNMFFKEVFYAKNGKEVLEIYEETTPDMLLLDVSMPILDGLEALKTIRKIDKDIVVVMLTAFDDKSTLLRAVELNITKFLVKPFNKQNFISMLEACAKKFSPKDIKIDEIRTLSLENMSIQSEQNLEIKLTKKEFLLLKFMLENRGRICQFDEILNAVYEYDKGSKDSLKAIIKELRKKCEFLSLENSFGLGYILK